ncbi:hypothetical protein WJ96_04040 [Burkholderia ubonensis]|uniref:Disulphide bond isomerase DsbC/G N-terminal domain-containing protein n=1 Tax=Burkholderia ubonensis TaxID=101571 RepID=A0AAW3MWZ7_9BURK|nr:disulfide isomerase DsbC N-terminal domain-containing protein [Burkholderia ubonensis]KVP65546.1 hypothetical protein WJ93_23785 [Burkholderia ubonensis]KVP96401.1 hypothetical protein WJ97_10955 [Burkholderia ubonensis]KVP97746.1 hypothetical protein WJ96_04040 [Burkholderia ubonensis]KVZ92443.1 hypothetical protein WL25_15695 [Burkholderia ubonensis]
MPMDLPPNIPQAAIVAPAPECRYITNSEAQVALQRLRQRLPSTAFDNARPSEICGLVRLQMASGKVVYTEPTGRYLMLTFALDTHRGSPADTSDELEKAIESRSRYPDKPIPGLTPPEPEALLPEGPLMTPIQPAGK